MSPESPERRKAAFRSAFTARPSVIPPKYPEISSLLTTVRLLSDRTHLHCVRSPNSARQDFPRLAPAAVSPLPLVFGNAPCSRTPARRGRSRRRKQGGPGQSPASPACCLPLNPGAAPRCSGRSPSTQCGDSSLLSAWFSLHAVPSLFVYPTCHFF